MPKSFIWELPYDSWIVQYPQVENDIKMTEQDYHQLWSEHPDHFEQFEGFGNPDLPRWTASFLQNYHYSRAEHPPQELTNEYLKFLLSWSNWHCQTHYPEFRKHKLNQMLVNWYGNGDQA